ncbi:hypothetical protein L6164_021520 [Bauhinia variegata]|uniref:Uncharacterized protein n=1 Tax=Bauhinia variegata TaxID=167791 RepID=A0ACB9MYE8_BAUVA|nr:hypothetical protein L6164_021520 [Bauhinia variegata]
MEAPSVEEERAEQHIPQAQKRKGGLITMPFIIANEALAKVASVGLVPNMILYLIGDYRLRVAKAANIIFLWSAATNFTPVLAAFIADSYVGRFHSIGSGSIISFLGMALMLLTAMISQARPPPCSHSIKSCKSATGGQLAILLLSFALVSIGGGGISCSLAFGADQLYKKVNPKKQRVLESFISWYIASQAMAVIIALTGIIYMQDQFGWKVGFGVPAALMLLSTILFYLASSIYVKEKPHSSLFTGFAQVIVAAYKNRKLPLPPRDSAGKYHHMKDSDLVVPTDKLRFLNKACIIRDPEQDITADGSASNPWSVCTIQQVEELKAIIKVIPLWSSGIMVAVSASQTSFHLLQAKSMDRHITSNFEIPAGSYSVFMMLAIFATVGVYDRVILPLASKIRGKPVRISAKNRIGIGLFFSFLDFVSTAIVETMRRRKAIQEGHIDNGQALVNMSAMWLLLHNCLCGMAEAFNAIGQSEFFYSEFPKTMSSIASSLFNLGMAAGNLLSSVIINIVDDVTSGGGKEGWISDNINKGRYDKYYWILAVMSFINILYYLGCSWAYGPSAETVPKEGDLTEPAGKRVRCENEEEKVGSNVGEMSKS